MDRRLEILLVEDDVELCNELSQLIYMSDDMLLIGATNNAYKAIEIIKDKLPDVLLLDLELSIGCGNGINVLQELRMSPTEKTPYILVVTNNTSNTTYEIVRSLGADFIISKHQQDFSPKYVLDFLRIAKPTILGSQKSVATKKNSSTETQEQYERRIKQRISYELNRVGINPKSIGYTYLQDSIRLMLEKPRAGICTAIADIYKKSEPSVERAMQNAINRAWKTTDIESLLTNYTAKISSEKGTPTLTEFICYYANKLRNEY